LVFNPMMSVSTASFNVAFMLALVVALPGAGCGDDEAVTGESGGGLHHRYEWRDSA